MKSRFVTFLHAVAIVLRCKHDFGQWCHSELMLAHAAPKHIVLIQMLFYGFLFAVERRTGP